MTIAAPRAPKMVAAVASMMLFTTVLAGCSISSTSKTASPAMSSRAQESDLLEVHDLSGLDVAQIIEKLDTMPVADRPAGLIASVQPEALVLTDDQGREATLAMPDDQVYLSIAPFRTQTHDCYFHSLTTCLGELANEDVQVTVTGDDGDVLLDQALQTFDNGFVGIWVPRGTAATLDIEHEGRVGSAEISTKSADDPTCITTLQLV